MRGEARDLESYIDRCSAYPLSLTPHITLHPSPVFLTGSSPGSYDAAVPTINSHLCCK
jgi:hypothetical protein